MGLELAGMKRGRSNVPEQGVVELNPISTGVAPLFLAVPIHPRSGFDFESLTFREKSSRPNASSAPQFARSWSGWRDPLLDRPAPILERLFFADETWTPILLTGQGCWGRQLVPALAVVEKAHGKGRVIVCQITLAGRIVNPVARLFAAALVGPRS